jgi:exodeoxyribonuclease V beta subunit
VEASAGTGKTYNITSLYIRALIELDISVGNILVVTYTEAATKELKDRLLKRIRQSISVLKNSTVDDEGDQFLYELLDYVDDRPYAINQLQKAVRSFDESAIYTIHGFCYQALQEQAFESRALYDAELIGDDAELVLEAVDDYWRNWVQEVSKSSSKQALLKHLMDRGYGPEKLAKELGPHLGKPYLKILPAQVDDNHIDKQLQKLRELYPQLREIWQKDREEIFGMLDSGHLAYYRTDWLQGWMQQMDEMLAEQTPPVTFFDKFERFEQSYIDDSLKSASEKEGIQPPEHPFFKIAEEYRQAAQPLQNFEVIFKKRLLLHLRDELKQKKEDLQVLSYDDLLLRLRDALFDEQRGKALADKLRDSYPIAMVDEFQDTDPSQYDIFRKIYSNEQQSALFMIGDPKQSIYSFRGADVFSYLKAKKDASKQNTFGLSRNFRSTPRLIEGLNTLFGSHDNPFILDRISFEPVTPGWDEEDYDQLTEYGKQHPPIRFRHLPLREQEQLNKTTAAERVAKDTAGEIYRYIEDGKSADITIGSKTVEANDIAVLVRTHKQAALMAEALRDRGIKSVQYSQESVFDSEEADQLQVLLKAVIEPSNETLIKTALALPLTAFTGRDLYDIEEDEERWISVLDQFARWHQTWQQKGFAAMFRSIIQEADVADHLMQYQNGERRLTNLLHLGELMQDQAQKQKNGMRGLLKWLARKREEENAQQDEEQLRLESDQELVKIVTMHRSKGLEYPIVFCPFLWYGPYYSDKGQPLVYHDRDNLEKTYLDLNGKSDPDRNEKRVLMAREELAESLRLAYVAMTRAKHCCHLSWAYANKSELSPLGYLLLNSDRMLDLLTETISQNYNAIGHEPFEDAIAKLCEQNSELFTDQAPASKKEKEQQLEMMNFGDEPQLHPREFDRMTPIESSYAISSFSSLSSWMEEDDPDLPDYDQFLDTEEYDKGTIEEEPTIFNFPKGPQPGTCIHKIFEEVDFKDPGKSNEIIKEQLVRYGIDKRWKPIVHKMLGTVLSANIHPSNEELRLQNVETDAMIPELEFYYQTGDIETNQLLSIIRKNFEPQPTGRGRAPSGFLKGYIDLTFKFGGKYYLLDYKSNYLGDSCNKYRKEHLLKEMREASYDLQYHIYAIALHRFLQNRLDDYSYQEHFGGAFYLFVRGMNEDGREGIYFDRPDYSIIESLNDYILAGGDDE